MMFTYGCSGRDKNRPKLLKARWLAKVLFLPLFFLLVTQSAAQSISPAANPFSATMPGPGTTGLALTGSPTLDSFGQAWGIGKTGIFVGQEIPNRGAGQFHEIETKDSSLFGLQGARYEYLQNGKYLAVSQTISCRTDFDLTGEAWFLLPTPWAAYSYYQFTGAREKSIREWETDCTHYFFDAAIYNRWFPGLNRSGWSQIIGLRYDHFFRRLKNPQGLPGPNPLPIASSPSDVVEVTADSWVPYAGIQCVFGNAGARGTFRMIGGPVITQLSHRETWDAIGREDQASVTFTRPTFFCEGYGEYALLLSKSTELGIFLKMGSINGYAEGFLESSVGGGAAQSVYSNFTYRKILYVFGANCSLTFDLPF